jgi:hypothetical protein
LVFGGHGMVVQFGSSLLAIGATEVGIDHDYTAIPTLQALRPYLSANARVYIAACKVGYDTELLSNISNALGGVPVYGFTNFVTATNLGIAVLVDTGVGESIDD